ncbi:MAG TPA: hypothetical protein VEA37_06885, partial [Flavobacterium sp.]|nr:hypothetical protein [Flavobacterium sp.]
MKTWIKNLFTRLWKFLGIYREIPVKVFPKTKWQLEDEVCHMHLSLGTYRQRIGKIKGLPTMWDGREWVLVKFGRKEELVEVTQIAKVNRGDLHERVLAEFKEAMLFELNANLPKKGLSGFTNGNEQFIFKELKDHADKYYGAAYQGKELQL